MWFPNRFDTNRAVQAQKIARSFIFYFFFFLFCFIFFFFFFFFFFSFAYADCLFSHNAAQYYFKLDSL